MKKLFVFFLLGLLFLPSQALAQNPSYFNQAVSSDTNITNGTSNIYSTGSGPIITETAPGQITTGTLILNAPGNYVLKSDANVSLVITGDANPNKNILATIISVTTSQITVSVTRASSAGTPNSLRFQGIEIRPINGQLMMMGTTQFYFDGSSINGTNITEHLVKQVPGQPASFMGWANDTMVTVSGTPFHVQVFATDAYHNFTKVLTDTPFCLAVKSGTGILHGDLNGLILAGNNNGIIPALTYSVAELNILLYIKPVNNPSFTDGEILFSSLQGSQTNNPVSQPCNLPASPSPSASPSNSPSPTPSVSPSPSMSPSPSPSPSASTTPSPTPTASPSTSNSPEPSPSPSPEALATATITTKEDISWEEIYVDPKQILNTSFPVQKITYINNLSLWDQIREILSFRWYRFQMAVAQLLWVGTEGFEPPTSSV